MMKAFEVTINGWDDLEIIVAAETPGKAKSFEHSKANEVGYTIDFTQFRARRATQFDCHLTGNADHAYELGHRDRDGDWGCFVDTAVPHEEYE